MAGLCLYLTNAIAFDPAHPPANHYRYDYDKLRDSAPARRAKLKQQEAIAQPSHAQHPSPQYGHHPQSHEVHDRSSPQSQPALHQSSQESQPSSTTDKTPTQQKTDRLRMVTLLIEDRRTGENPMLVEVKVPLRPVTGPPDYFWAEALDIARTLQESPARIDGQTKK